MDSSFFPLALLLLFTSNIFPLTSSSDQEALLAFKHAITSDPNGVLRNNWSSNTSICYWTGVSCGLKHHRVTALNLSGLALGGNLPPHLGNLTFLQSLDISSNNFTGDIPSGIFTNMSELVEINLSSNKLSGQLPNDTCRDMPKLQIIHLRENQLSGKIPVSIYLCTELEELSLTLNQFDGNIPTELGNLRMLTVLSVHSNNLQGNIPSSIFNISTLKNIYLHNNKLSGSIPANLNNLPNLKELYLSSNNLTGGIPKQVGNLTSLIELDLASNKLTGELPKEVGNLAYLEILLASFNDFLSGPIPSSIFNISTLKTLSLQQNQFSGTLPSNMGNSLPNLQQLYLFFNKLSGEIPTSITNASMLTMLELNRNFFTGSIPDFGNLRLLQTLRLWENNLTGVESPDQELKFLSSLTNCKYLESLEISNNPLMNGILPPSIGNLSTSLITFSASNCSIRGVIPSGIGNLISLQTLDLSKNRLTGFIPTTMGKLNQVVKLHLYDNQLQGTIPSHLCQMSYLGELYLSGNMLTGVVPKCLGGVKSLRTVSFASNKLNSTLPSEFFDLKDIINLNLSSNSFSGQLPSQIGSLRAINYLDLSSNNFSGNIPTALQNCKSLVSLSLSNNKFNGSIPQSLGEVLGLSDLDLSNNDLTGVIPESLEKLDLESFNVSYNKLQGKIPEGGFFGNFTAESFAHNADLCGATRFGVPPCKDGRSRSRSRSRIVVIMKYVVPPFIGVIIFVIIVVFLIKRRKQKEIAASVRSAADISSVGVSWKIISERELSQGTRSFSEINLLGKGSFGSVFKATLADGTHVSVKVFNLASQGAIKSFETESQILSSIRHRNLVKILGCCSNEEFKALVLEYMPNGCLDKWIHSDKFVLDLVERLRIAIDVALALEYLHHDHTFTVVHCDIKPSNVLLDEDMTARVCDFGISKLFDVGEAALHTISMATIGYAAPELGSKGKISTSGDVYSYGILLLELFTSKRPTDDMFGAEMSIKVWVEKALQENVISEVVAPGLLSTEDPHFFAKEECLSSIFALALKCLEFAAEKRINMTQVVAALQKVKLTVEATRKRQRSSGSG